MKKLCKCIGILIVVVAFGVALMTNEKPYALNTNKIAVLGYHHLSSPEDKKQHYRFDPWTTSTEVFEKQMAYLSKHGYHTISLDTLYDWYLGKCELDNKAVVLTFDDSYYSTYQIAKPILEKYGFNATCFVIGYNIPDKATYNPPSKQHIPRDLLVGDEILQFGSHFHHLHRKIDGKYAINVYSKDELLNDVALASKAVATDYMAYPFGKSNETVFEVLEASKVKMAFTYQNYQKMTRDSYCYALPRFAIHAYTPMPLFIAYLNQ